MNDLDVIYQSISDRIDDILSHWTTHVEREPWLELPPEARIDHLPELIGALVGVLRTPNDAWARRRMLRLGVKHGVHRRQNGFSDDLLHREHYLLRSAVWQIIRDLHGSSRACFQAIARFDVALTHATTASLQGYHIGAGDPPLTEAGIVERLSETDLPWPPAPEE